MDVHSFSPGTLEAEGIQGQTGHQNECQWEPASKRKQKKQKKPRMPKEKNLECRYQVCFF